MARKLADLTQPLKPIYRILYCGNCKAVWQCRGQLKVLKKGLRRTFKCPNCRELVRQDWFKKPTLAAIETLEHREPMWVRDELIEFNKMLLAEETKE